ncbi:beta-ribofuranosylaminobenzene 5'-phosphate synthase family protein [Haloquadratum walsbyi]|jgi:beta-RFAP synthase|uniref:Beta-ribofuranosylaminobenzene 5'-phosphate synthase n=1 Tax=Haloquadratum walsbyi J07HQW2 TaxID=1238425 RepID=U1PNU6_9EURY|nr:beta-ribofuranosylaminobenzene 5'-phosphate synthase family protein [Haloquadratum walsbyi]ERG95382.1 MAG: beta-RFAP synthase [Haloquadratum walsbyi J07HQW2]
MNSGRVRVTTGGRIHFGFLNLSLAQDRLYGGIGLSVREPTTTVVAEPIDDSGDAPTIVCSHSTAHEHATRAVDILNLDSVSVNVESALPRHAGLGSGTQLALTTLTAVANAYDQPPQPRENAPTLGRGGRSGIGVGTFETGGFIIDGGHSTARFTIDRPSDGSWAVPPVITRQRIPDSWRFLLLIPDVDPGRSGTEEEASMRSVIKQASPDIADRIAGTVMRKLLPAIATENAEQFGTAVKTIGRLNGRWYTDEQGGVYRPPAGELVASLNESSSCYGAGQSSWGPTVYGITDVEHAEAARDAGQHALDAAGVDGNVRVVRGQNDGVTVKQLES